MEPDCRARHGLSYNSARRRIRNSVATTMRLACGQNELVSSEDNPEIVETLGSSPMDATDVINGSCEQSIAGADSVSIDNNADSDDGNSSISTKSYCCSLSDCDSDSERDAYVDDPPPSIAAELAKWVVANNISLDAARSLLSLLRPHHPSLPADPRTLLKTPLDYDFKEIKGSNAQSVGHYYHFGITSGIIDLVPESHALRNETLKLQFNFDGLPLFKSSSMEFWPILCAITNLKNCRPFVVGLYCGTKKPSDVSEYVADFVNELQQLLETGVTRNEINLIIQIDCFVCDAPARAFIKNVKGHGGYHGCEKCVQEGVYVNKRMTFPETNARLRTDEEFESMADEGHHRGRSPLSVLPVGLVTDFVYEYMHLVCLGVTKKMIKFWLGGTLRSGENVASRLPAHSVQLLSERLSMLSGCIPREFARLPRTMSEVDRWKATEFRMFLLYTGPVTLAGILSQNVYDHFMLLSVGISLLISPVHCQVYNDYAHSLLVAFVESASTLYSKDFLVYNVHGLVHLAADVRRHGSLDSFSAFQFENELKSLKRLVRKAGNPLAQCVRRLTEQQRVPSFDRISSDDCVVKPTIEHNSGPIPDGFEEATQFRMLTMSGYKVSVKRSPSDCCVAIQNVGPVIVLNVLLLSESLYIVCRKFESLTDTFLYPLPSSKIGIYKAGRITKQMHVFPVADIVSKCVCLPVFDNNIANHHYNIFPVVHTVSNTPK